MRLRTQRVRALTMGRFRQGSIARRVAISAFALYALLLHGFLAASAPPAAFAFPGGISCAQDGSGSGTSGGDPVRHHGLCCILACAAAACAHVATPSAVSVFPTRVASTIDFAPALGTRGARPPQILFCRARSSHRRLIAPAVSRLRTAILFPPLGVTSCLPLDRNVLAAR